MQDSALVCVIDRARDLGHESSTLVRLRLQARRGGAQTSTAREFHAVKGQPFLALPDLVNRQDVGMIELRHRFGFAAKTDERLGRLGLIGEDAFEGDNAAGVTLPRTIDHAHPAAADCFQDFVVPELPVSIFDFRFREHTGETLGAFFALLPKRSAEEMMALPGRGAVRIGKAGGTHRYNLTGFAA